MRNGPFNKATGRRRKDNASCISRLSSRGQEQRPQVEIGQNRDPLRAPRTHELAAQEPRSKIERSRRGRCVVFQRPSKKIDSRGTLQTTFRFTFMVATTWREMLSLRSSGKGVRTCPAAAASASSCSCRLWWSFLEGYDFELEPRELGGVRRILIARSILHRRQVDGPR